MFPLRTCRVVIVLAAEMVHRAAMKFRKKMKKHAVPLSIRLPGQTDSGERSQNMNERESRGQQGSSRCEPGKEDPRTHV